jgi:hypothetical protein
VPLPEQISGVLIQRALVVIPLSPINKILYHKLVFSTYENDFAVRDFIVSGSDELSLQSVPEKFLQLGTTMDFFKADPDKRHSPKPRSGFISILFGMHVGVSSALKRASVHVYKPS